MVTVSHLDVAILFCIVTMLGWGSWANTQKLAGRQRWPFPLYYFDYAIGVLVFAVLLFFTAGSYGRAGMPAWPNLLQANKESIWRAIGSGALFNLSNILLVVAIDAAGMTIAFPVGVGLALVIGTVISYLETPKGNAALLSSGVVLVVAAMIVSALAHRRMHRAGGNRKTTKGLIFALIAGLLMGQFYPQLARTISPDFGTAPIQPGLLTPYAALLLFGAGMLASNLFINTVFIRSERLRYREYAKASPRLHLLGLAGGAIWMLALACNILASGVAGPAVSYALGQGATLVAALWGVFIWKEFRGGPNGIGTLIALMLVCYTVGLVLVGMATL